MRVVVLGFVLAGLFFLVPAAEADIYLFRDGSGVLHLTNAPANPGSQVVMRESAQLLDRAVVAMARRAAATAAGAVGRAHQAYDVLIREIAERYNVEYALVKAIIKAESGFDRLAVSRKGALGLMQLMPATAAQHQVRDAFTPRDNIEGGVRHLRMLLDRYSGNIALAVAAYNAGATRVEEAGGIPAIQETREYLARVLRYRVGYLRESAGVFQQARR